MRYGPNEDFAVAAIAGMSDAHNRLDNLLDHFVMRNDLDARFLHVLDEILDNAMRSTLMKVRDDQKRYVRPLLTRGVSTQDDTIFAPKK